MQIKKTPLPIHLLNMFANYDYLCGRLFSPEA